MDHENDISDKEKELMEIISNVYTKDIYSIKKGQADIFNLDKKIELLEDAFNPKHNSEFYPQWYLYYRIMRGIQMYYYTIRKLTDEYLKALENHSSTDDVDTIKKKIENLQDQFKTHVMELFEDYYRKEETNHG